LLENRHRSLDQRLSAVAAFIDQEAWGDSLDHLREETREYATGLPDGQGIRVRTASGVLLYEKKSTDPDTFERTRLVTVRGHPLEITLYISLADFHRTLRTLAWVMCAVFPVVLLFAAGGGWWLAKRALRPVGAMTREARQITAQDLSARVSVPGTADELQELAEAWNQLLARIESAVLAVKRFTADAAHELRTPITVIRTSAELALRQRRSEESYRQTLASIEQETMQMSELVEQLLLLARGDAGEWRFRFDTVFADQVLRNLRTVLKPLAEKNRIEIAWEIPEESVMIRADDSAIRRLMLILLDNAIKHTPEGGSVSVRLSGGIQCRIEVEDTGGGISADHLPHIFERFYRADAARSPGGGSGLGLAIARTIVQAHEGSIEVFSSAGSGTRFVLQFPMGPPAPPEDPGALRQASGVKTVAES